MLSPGDPHPCGRCRRRSKCLNSRVDKDSTHRPYDTDTHHKPRRLPPLPRRSRPADALCGLHLLRSSVLVVAQLSLQRGRGIRMPRSPASNGAITELPLRAPQSRSGRKAWHFVSSVRANSGSAPQQITVAVRGSKSAILLLNRRFLLSRATSHPDPRTIPAPRADFCVFLSTRLG